MYAVCVGFGQCGCGSTMGGKPVEFCSCFSPSVAWCTGIHTMVAQAVRLRPSIVSRQQMRMGSRRKTGDTLGSKAFPHLSFPKPTHCKLRSNSWRSTNQRRSNFVLHIHRLKNQLTPLEKMSFSYQSYVRRAMPLKSA